jgi:hypothetical protein
LQVDFMVRAMGASRGLYCIAFTPAAHLEKSEGASGMTNVLTNESTADLNLPYFKLDFAGASGSYLVPKGIYSIYRGVHY